MLISPLIRFLTSHGASAFATGVHGVLLAWVAVTEYQLTPGLLGWVQAAVLLPNLSLMLVAGVWADRHDPAKLVALAQGLLSLCYLGLFLTIVFDIGSFFTLMIYALGVGLGNALIQPAREKLLSAIELGSLQKRISLFSVVQFSCQSAGMAVVALTDSLGVSAIIAAQAMFSFVACGLFFTLKKNVKPGAPEYYSVVDDIRGSFSYVKKTPGLGHLLFLVAFNGYMHMGVFLVMIPVIAMNMYHFDVREYASLQFLFVFGMVCAHFMLLRKKTIQFPGQGALFCLLYTAGIGFGLSKGPTPFGLYSLVFFWGVVAGSSASQCRLVLRSLTDDALQGRVMSLYQLMLFGAAPIGALVTGYVLNYLDVESIFDFMSLSSIALFAFFMLTRTLWAVTQSIEEHSVDGKAFREEK